MKFMKKVLASALAGFALASGVSTALAADQKLKIGFITDMSSLYSAKEGKDGAMVIQWAIDDFGGKVNGMPIELLTADHQNKADIASSKAREWIDTQGLTVVFGGTNSGADLAMAKVAQEKKKVFLTSGGSVTALTNEQCSPYTVQYDFDTGGLAKGIANAVVARGDKTWYFLSADYAFGQSMQTNATAAINAAGGKVVGSIKHPINSSDFSSFLLQAQSSNAQVLAFANAGGDFENAVKSAREFGITKTMKMVGMLVLIDDINSLGLKNTEGLMLVTTWDWNLDERSRIFGKRFYDKTKRMPTSVQAADYSATMTYLKAVQAAGTADSDKVMAQLKKAPIDDFYGKGYIRADGRFIHDAYLVQVKSPAESRQPWDYFKVLSRLNGEELAIPKAESKCPLLK